MPAIFNPYVTVPPQALSETPDQVAALLIDGTLYQQGALLTNVHDACPTRQVPNNHDTVASSSARVIASIGTGIQPTACGGDRVQPNSGNRHLSSITMSVSGVPVEDHAFSIATEEKFHSWLSSESHTNKVD
jgi:hypothetical protein